MTQKAVVVKVVITDGGIDVTELNAALAEGWVCRSDGKFDAGIDSGYSQEGRLGLFDGRLATDFEFAFAFARRACVPANALALMANCSLGDFPDLSIGGILSRVR